MVTHGVPGIVVIILHGHMFSVSAFYARVVQSLGPINGSNINRHLKRLKLLVHPPSYSDALTSQFLFLLDSDF